MDWSGLRLRLGKRFFDEARLKRRWKLDERSPFEEVRMLDPEPVNSILDEAAASLRDYYPRFQPMRIAERWAGVIDATPDVVPCISALPKIDGLYLASGFSGHGFGLGPGAGKLMAQMVMGETLCVDPTPFRLWKIFRWHAGRGQRPACNQAASFCDWARARPMVSSKTSGATGLRMKSKSFRFIARRRVELSTSAETMT